MEPPMFQLVPMASGHHQEDPGSILSAPFQVFMYIKEIPPELFLLLTKPSQLSQSVLVGKVLQSLHHPSLNSLQSVRFSLVLGTPEYDTALQTQPHQW